MSAAEPGTVVQVIKNREGSAITVTQYFDPDTKEFKSPAFVVVNESSYMEKLLARDSKGVLYAKTIFPGVTSIGKEWIPTITKVSQLSSLTLDR